MIRIKAKYKEEMLNDSVYYLGAFHINILKNCAAPRSPNISCAKDKHQAYSHPFDLLSFTSTKYKIADQKYGKMLERGIHLQRNPISCERFPNEQKDG